MMEKAYFAYPLSEYGSKEVERLKRKLSARYELIDPYEVNGIGNSVEIAKKDLALIDECDIFIVYMPKKALYPIQTSMELMYSFIKGKKIKLITEHDGPFIRLVKENASSLRNFGKDR